MKNKIRSFNSLSLGRRVFISMALVTFFPLLVVVSYFSGLYIPKSALACVFSLMIIGWWLLFEVFLAIRKMYIKCRPIEEPLGGVVNHGESEIERLNAVFNSISSRMKESVEELKDVSSKAAQINRQITQKVDVFSCMIQAGILFSQGRPASEIIKNILESLKAVTASRGVCALIKNEKGWQVFTYGIDEDKAIKLTEAAGFDFSSIREMEACDSKNKIKGRGAVRSVLTVENFLINPLYMRDKIIGYIIAVNDQKGYEYNPEVMEITELFSRNLSIIWEHEVLSRKVEDLEITDHLTGFYNSRFFMARLEEEIKRAMAYQRPCGLLLIDISGLLDKFQKAGDEKTESALNGLAALLSANVRPIDILGRLDGNIIGVILIERNRRQSQYLADKINEALNPFLLGVVGGPAGAARLAVAETPLDGVTAADLYNSAKNQISAVKK
jgi:diguanylate cyclase (GGDEF)-like protein